jgi:hypothetical protein
MNEHREEDKSATINEIEETLEALLGYLDKIGDHFRDVG